MTALRDGNEYVVHLRDDALVCFRTPPPDHPDPACAGLVAPGRPGKETLVDRMIAVATVRIPDGDGTAMASVVLHWARRAFPMEPEKQDVAAYAREFASGFAQTMPQAHMHPGAPGSELWKIDGLPLARFTIDLDDVPDDKVSLQHTVTFAAWSRDGVYMLSFMTSAPHAHAVDAFADESIASLTLAHRAPTRTYTIAYYGTQLVLYAFVAAAIAFFVARSVRKSRRNRELIAAGLLVMVPPRKKEKAKRPG